MKLLKAFGKDHRGVSAMELALCLPALFIIMFGTVEGATYIYANQKVESAAANVLNLINQQNNPSLSDLRTIAKIVNTVVGDEVAQGAQSQVVITAMQRDRASSDPDKIADPYVFWQYKFGSAALGASQFKYNGPGDNKKNKLPAGAINGFEFMEGDQIVAVEVFITYTAKTTTPFSPKYERNMYYMNFARPRKQSFQMRPDEKI